MAVTYRLSRKPEPKPQCWFGEKFPRDARLNAAFAGLSTFAVDVPLSASIPEMLVTLFPMTDTENTILALTAKPSRFHPRSHPRGLRREGVVDGVDHPVSAGTQWLSAYRPRQVDLPEFRQWRRSSTGSCNLRFDDTNPAKEDQEFIDAIQADVEMAWMSAGAVTSNTPPIILSGSTNGQNT